MLVITPTIRIPLDEIAFTFVHSAGPGGQNVNKLNTKAVLRWPIAATPSLPDAVRSRFVAKYPNRLTSEGELVLTSQRFRDQSRTARIAWTNFARCCFRLPSRQSSASAPNRPWPAANAVSPKSAAARNTNNSAATAQTTPTPTK